MAPKRIQGGYTNYIVDSENLPDPDILAQEIVEKLGVALSEFQGIVDELGNGNGGIG